MLIHLHSDTNADGERKELSGGVNKVDTDADAVGRTWLTTCENSKQGRTYITDERGQFPCTPVIHDCDLQDKIFQGTHVGGIKCIRAKDMDAAGSRIARIFRAIPASSATSSALCCLLQHADSSL